MTYDRLTSVKPAFPALTTENQALIVRKPALKPALAALTDTVQVTVQVSVQENPI